MANWGPGIRGRCPGMRRDLPTATLFQPFRLYQCTALKPPRLSRAPSHTPVLPALYVPSGCGMIAVHGLSASPVRLARGGSASSYSQDPCASLQSDISRPFDKPEPGRIAVKVINHLGDEVMKVFRVE